MRQPACGTAGDMLLHTKRRLCGRCVSSSPRGPRVFGYAASSEMRYNDKIRSDIIILSYQVIIS